MCMIESADGDCTYYDSFWRTAKQGHRCGECHREIRPGERYQRNVWKTDGTFGSAKTCAHCAEAAKWLIRECHGYLFGGVEQDLLEHWEEGLDVAEYRTLELGRLLVGMRRKWERRSGGLMPLPKVHVKSAEVRA